MSNQDNNNTAPCTNPDCPQVDDNAAAAADTNAEATEAVAQDAADTQPAEQVDEAVADQD